MSSTVAVILDLDGTLIDSAPDICAALNWVLEGEDRRPVSVEETKGLIGQGVSVLIEKAMARSGSPSEPEHLHRLVEMFLTSYRARPVENTVIYPGVIDVLEGFTAEGRRMGICTNKPRVTTVPVVQAFDLERFFDVIVCGDTVPHQKPDGRHLHHTLELLGADPMHAIMVGDSENDFGAARDAGIPFVAVAYGYSRVPVAELDADAVIDDFRDLPLAIGEIFKRRARP